MSESKRDLTFTKIAVVVFIMACVWGVWKSAIVHREWQDRGTIMLQNRQRLDVIDQIHLRAFGPPVQPQKQVPVPQPASKETPDVEIPDGDDSESPESDPN